jgi:hypothetical protein
MLDRKFTLDDLEPVRLEPDRITHAPDGRRNDRSGGAEYEDATIQPRPARGPLADIRGAASRTDHCVL